MGSQEQLIKDLNLAVILVEAPDQVQEEVVVVVVVVGALVVLEDKLTFQI